MDAMATDSSKGLFRARLPVIGLRCDAACAPRRRAYAAGMLAAGRRSARWLLASMMLAVPPVGQCQPAPEPCAGATGAGMPLRQPLVIAHRGASAYLPEHTLAAYAMALDQGADCIEADVVATSDGQLIVRHDNQLDLTTDVAAHPEFADRRRTRRMQARELTGWFSEDFTLAEVRTLRARERIPELRPGSAQADGRFPVPSLDDVLTFIREQESLRRRPICFLPEIKSPRYFERLGLPLEERMVGALRQHGYRGRSDPVIIQSFEIAALRKLRTLADFQLLQLLGEGLPPDVEAAGGTLSYRQMATPAGLAEIAQYADAIGPPKDFLPAAADAGSSPDLGAMRRLVAAAHAQGLAVYPYTFRGESRFVLPAFRSGARGAFPRDLVGELTAFWAVGVDGVFVDNPDIGVAARRALACRRRGGPAARAAPEAAAPMP